MAINLNPTASEIKAALACASKPRHVEGGPAYRMSTRAIPALSPAYRTDLGAWMQRVNNAEWRPNKYAHAAPAVTPDAPICHCANGKPCARHNGAQYVARPVKVAPRAPDISDRETIPRPVRQRQIARQEGERAALTTLPPVRARKAA